MPICPHCQQTISVGRRICPACSRSLETPCPFCGFQLPGLFTRCPRCRQRLDVDAAAPPPASSSEEHGPPQPPPGAAPADAAGAPAPSPPLAAAAPAEPPPPCAAPAATAAIEPPLPSMAPAATAAPSSSSPAPPAQVALPVPPAAAAQTVSPAPVRVVGDPLVGQVLDGRFAVIQRLGTGGMGTVYKAQQLSVDRPVALKVMLPGCSGSPEQVARFMAEARTASQLRHPNTVVIFDFGRTEDGRLYLAMELLEGHQLTDLLREAGPLPWSRALGILVQICGSLSEAHQKGFLHRDIKPDNIIVGEMNGI
ncbi:MAG: hypothetical protein FJ125_07935, partial [Deltaproteobacteria bacterium]|nr:hypothetical protein [Deltaproteobacteria bacterium]